MNIEDLLHKYFEGETSAEEEALLRNLFASGEVPEQWNIYKPLFGYFDEEIKREQEQKHQLPTKKPVTLIRKTLYWVSGVAAVIALFLVINHYSNPADPCLCSGNYVVINGRCYTDIHTVRSMAVDALREVATPVKDYFPEGDVMTDHEIVENQLKELSSLFSEDD